MDSMDSDMLNLINVTEGVLFLDYQLQPWIPDTNSCWNAHIFYYLFHHLPDFHNYCNTHIF